MHRPPAVSHTVGRSRWHACLLIGIWLAALGPLTYFSIFQTSPLPSATLAAIWLVGGWFSARAWRASATGLLQWDGENWQWIRNDEGQACLVHMVWDFQLLVLARWVAADAPSRWLWLEPGRNMPQWDALRRALVSTKVGFIEPSPDSDLEGQR